MTAHKTKARHKTAEVKGSMLISQRDGRLGSKIERTGIAGLALQQKLGATTISKRISEVRDGLPVTELTELAGTLTISRDQLAAILGITIRTLQRKAGSDVRLGAAASDRLARVKRIFDLAEHVLGDRERAARWMTSASRPLGGELPLQLLDTDIGTQRVEQELHEIKYSFPA
jgi:putative toxin-antitoxin system antitoxin component (TIGR02293 family)